MRDKQIIIDGVDVSECIHIDEWKHCNCCNDLIKTVYPNATKCHTEKDLRCETYPNCYFKQLARKTQLSIKQSKELIRLRKELQESTVKNRNLRQECEELKEQLQANQPTGICETCMATAILQNDKYRKALEEIEGLVKKATELPCVFSCDCNNCAEKPTKHWDTCIQGAIYKIADIINEIQEIK